MAEILTRDQVAEMEREYARDGWFGLLPRLIASHEALQAKLDTLLQPPDVDCWKELVRLAYLDDGDGARRIQRITAEYNRMKTERDAARNVLGLAYQAAGVLGAPAWVLDILSDACNGAPLRHKMKPLNPDGATAMTLQQASDAATRKAFEEAAEIADARSTCWGDSIAQTLRRRAGEIR